MQSHKLEGVQTVHKWKEYRRYGMYYESLVVEGQDTYKSKYRSDARSNQDQDVMIRTSEEYDKTPHQPTRYQMLKSPSQMLSPFIRGGK
jgi:hypothetical protein